MTEGQEAGRIRQLIVQGSLPWKENLQKESLLQQVVRVVERCCNLRPDVRPSAADVAHSLFDILTLADLNIDSSPPIDEGVKVRVSELLEKVKTGSSEKLDDKCVQDLRSLVTQGDPTAAFFLGSAIWYGLAKPEDDLDQLLLVAGEDHCKGEFP